MSRRLIVTVGVLAALLLPGCGKTRIESNAGSPLAEPGTRINLQKYEAPRYRYTIRYPVGWHPGGSLQGDYLTISKPSPPDVGDPSIRIFVTETDPDKDLNMQPPKKEWLVGPGAWPHMSADSADDTRVMTVNGEVSGYFLRGRGTTRGIRYRAIGLNVFGTGHSIEVVCSSAEEDWPKWEGVCEEVIRTFVAGDLNTPRQPGSSKPATALNDLATLRDLYSPSRPDHTFPLPLAGHGLGWVISRGRIVWIEDGGTFKGVLRIISTDSGAEMWSKEFESSKATATAIGVDSIGIYSPASGLELIGSRGQRSFEYPYVGPAYLASGTSGRPLYLVERPAGQMSAVYHVVEPVPGGKAQTVSVKTPFRTFDPAQDTDEEVLLGCPNLRLMRGDKQIWEHQTQTCAGETGISSDGELAYGVLSERGIKELRVLGKDGNILWDRRLDSAKEGFVFAPGGKRFWFRQYDGEGTRPYLRVVDSKGTILKQWQFSSKEDNVLAVNDIGTLALVLVGDDVLGIDDQGVVKLRIPKARLLKTLLHRTEPVVYTISEVTHLGAVYRFDESHR